MLTLTGIDEVKANVGKELGVSDWLEVTQEAINEFADVTGDHQFIHVDVERAKDTPFGGTIAHGYYTLSLLPKFTYDLFSLEGFAFALNYGANRVRFPSPLPVGSKVRVKLELTNVEDVAGGIQMTTTATFGGEGGEKRVCGGEARTRAYGGGGPPGGRPRPGPRRPPRPRGRRPRPTARSGTRRRGRRPTSG